MRGDDSGWPTRQLHDLSPEDVLHDLLRPDSCYDLYGTAVADE